MILALALGIAAGMALGALLLALIISARIQLYEDVERERSTYASEYYHRSEN